MNLAFKNLVQDFKEREKAMPVFFMGHGSPMNGIQENEFSNSWAAAAQATDIPSAILVISAHWLTSGTKVTAMEMPKTIHDFGGFPQELFDVQYPAPGSPHLAEIIQQEIEATHVHLDHEWGLDHGAWTVVRHMYPEANIPVLQLSIDYFKPAEYHFQLAQQLKQLRKKGVLIMGSGNMIHNLRIVDWANLEKKEGYDWAEELNKIFVDSLQKREHKNLINYQNLGEMGKLAIPTPDHYYPLMYSLGLQDAKDEIEIFNNHCVAGSLSMTSVKWGI